jgi:hypothetical protein
MLYREHQLEFFGGVELKAPELRLGSTNRQ